MYIYNFFPISYPSNNFSQDKPGRVNTVFTVYRNIDSLFADIIDDDEKKILTCQMFKLKRFLMIHLCKNSSALCKLFQNRKVTNLLCLWKQYYYGIAQIVLGLSLHHVNIFFK